MTQDEIIEMAKQAGINYRELSDEFATGNGDGVEIEQMQAFAKLVAAKEREACARVCEKHAEVYASLPKTLTTDASWAACIDSRDAIRVRGEE
jgi:DNA-binding GntR family transcriptional regulator